MNIVVLIKQVPDTYSERKLSESDHTLDRASADAVIDEINEKAVEQALQLKENGETNDGGEAEITVVCVGPDRASDTIRKALSMGADKAIHVSDESLHGSDIMATATVLAKAIGRVENPDLVIAGNESTDGGGGAVPAMLAEMLGLPAATHLREVHIDGQQLTGTRETDEGLSHLQAQLPAIISVAEKINEPRYPSFKGIMAAKKKPVDNLALADLGLEAGQVGLEAAWSAVTEAAPKPPREAGQQVEDEGDGGTKTAEYLVSQKLI